MWRVNNVQATSCRVVLPFHPTAVLAARDFQFWRQRVVRVYRDYSSRKAWRGTDRGDERHNVIGIDCRLGRNNYYCSQVMY